MTPSEYRWQTNSRLMPVKRDNLLTMTEEKYPEVISLMYEAYGTDMEGLWQKYEREKRLREELERTNHELLVMKHKVIDFASVISEEIDEQYYRNRPFPQIWEEFTKRVEDKFLEAGHLKTLNERFRKELQTRRIKSANYLDD